MPKYSEEGIDVTTWIVSILHTLVVVILLYISLSFMFHGNLGEPVSDHELMEYLNRHRSELATITKFNEGFDGHWSPDYHYLPNSMPRHVSRIVNKLYTSLDNGRYVHLKFLSKRACELERFYIQLDDGSHWKHGHHFKALVHIPEQRDRRLEGKIINGDTNAFMAQMETLENLYTLYRHLGRGWYIEHRVHTKPQRYPSWPECHPMA